MVGKKGNIQRPIIWRDRKVYKKLLDVLLSNVQYIGYVKSLMTPSNSQQSDRIVQEIRKLVYDDLKSDSIAVEQKKNTQMKEFLETFALRILRDCNMVMQKEIYRPPPMKAWEGIVKSYMRAMLLDDEIYKKSLSEAGKSMTKTCLYRCSKKLFHVELVREDNITFSNYMIKMGKEVYQEDKETIEKIQSRAGLPCITYDEKECLADPLGRPKVWARAFTLSEETEIRKSFLVPCIMRAEFGQSEKTPDETPMEVDSNESDQDKASNSEQMNNTQESAVSSSSILTDEKHSTFNDSCESSDVELSESLSPTNENSATIPAEIACEQIASLADSSMNHEASLPIDTAGDDNDIKPIVPQETIKKGDDDSEPEITYSNVIHTYNQENQVKSRESWITFGNVAVGDCETQEFPIHNNTHTVIKLRGNIMEKYNSFKFLDGRKLTTNIEITFKPKETYQFAIIFCPYKVGAVTGRLELTQCEFDVNCKTPPLSITASLFGHGLHGTLSESSDTDENTSTT